jgi:hypothetical protein
MSRHAHYQELKALAREKRGDYGVVTEAFGLSVDAQPKVPRFMS